MRRFSVGCERIEGISNVLLSLADDVVRVSQLGLNHIKAKY